MTASGAGEGEEDRTLGLVLTGGGARSAYQVGVLEEIGRRAPETAFPVVTGVSAGAISAGYLASRAGRFGRTTRELREYWSALNTREVMRSDPLTMTAIVARWLLSLASGGMRVGPRARSMVDNRPLRIYLRDLIAPDQIDSNLERGALRALAVSATSYSTGRTVTFVHGRDEVSMWRRPQRVSRRERITLDHVMASAAIPILFPAVRVGDRYYGDGSIRQSTPLAPAIHLGASRILAISSRYPRDVEEARQPTVEGYPPIAQMAGVLANSSFLDTLETDVQWVERVNRLVSMLPEEKRKTEPLHQVDLLVIRPSKDLGRLAREYEAELPLAIRYLTRGLGTQESDSPDLVSYLLFEHGYLRRLIQLGREDAASRWPEIRDFLGLEAGDEAQAGAADGGGAAGAGAGAQ